MKLSDDHINSVYWLAERYRTVTIKKLKDTYKKYPKEFSEFQDPNDFPYTLMTKYTQPNGNCILCETKGHAWIGHSMCSCIHAMSNTLCTYQDTWCYLQQARNLKDMVKAMHKRAKYLYLLLDMYHAQKEI